jgi:cation-transporting ATPase 13A2
VFAGPVSESVPTSITSLAHRRERHDSTASFAFFQDEDERRWAEEEALDEDHSDEDLDIRDVDVDLETGSNHYLRRHSSSFSRASVENPLLQRRASQRSASSGHNPDGRFSQKTYIVTEDISIVIAGFKTAPIGNAIYVTLCILTFGVGYLILRWIPRWRIKLMGTPAPLEDCKWVVIEVSSPLKFPNNSDIPE